MQGPKPLLLAVTGLVLLVLGYLHTGPLGQGTNSIRIGKALDLHLEIDNAAALVTTKAVINSFVGIDGEGGGLFAMEGAQAEHIAAAALQIHILPHHIFNGVALDQFIDKRRRKCHISSPPL